MLLYSPGMEIILRLPIIYVTLLTISGFNNVIYDIREKFNSRHNVPSRL
jgi:hypothetical protein